MKKLILLVLLIGLLSCEMHYKLENLHPELIGEWEEANTHSIGYMGTDYSYEFSEYSNIVTEYKFTNIYYYIYSPELTVHYYTYEIRDDYMYFYLCSNEFGGYMGDVEFKYRYSHNGNSIYLDGVRYDKK